MCDANYGFAFRLYVEYLTENRATLKDDTERAMACFLRSLDGATLSGAQQHAARNFALLYAGAVMAKRAGLLPWNLAVTRRALRSCFLDGLGEIARVEGAEERARKTIMSHLDNLRNVDSVSHVKEVEGWFANTKRGRLYAVRTPCFREWLSGPEEERAALRWLVQDNLLKPTDGAKPDWPNVGWAVSWSEIGREKARCYMFYDPRGNIV